MLRAKTVIRRVLGVQGYVIINQIENTTSVNVYLVRNQDFDFRGVFPQVPCSSAGGQRQKGKRDHSPEERGGGGDGPATFQN